MSSKIVSTKLKEEEHDKLLQSCNEKGYYVSQKLLSSLELGLCIEERKENVRRIMLKIKGDGSFNEYKY